MSIVVATKGSKKNASGLTPIYLHLFAPIKGGHKYMGTVEARSGLAGLQEPENFRTKANQRKGIYEPCPEAHYKLNKLEWHGNPGDYNSRFDTIHSAVAILIDSERQIYFHEDYMPGTPGTAGCIGLLLPELKKLVNFINGYGQLTDLYTNWGKGTVHPPVTVPEHWVML